MAKTLSTDNYLQITQLMQAPVADRRNIILSLPLLVLLQMTQIHFFVKIKSPFFLNPRFMFVLDLSPAFIAETTFGQFCLLT